MDRHILIVEDEPKIASLLADYLHSAGFSTTHLDRGDSVERWLQQQHTDLILLDVMLPGKDGLELCKSIRRRRDTPIIMVTARVEEIDRLLGLELGADDYICKPFSPREVVARVKTILRRIRAGADSAPAVLSLDGTAYRASIKGSALSLTAVEFKLLQILVDQPGRIFSRDQLMDAMYTDHRIVSERTVDSHIKKLRKKIAERLPDREIIHSVYGVGYKYEPDSSH